MGKLNVFSSYGIFDEANDIKYNFDDESQKKDFIDFINSLSKEEKEELSSQIDLVLAKEKIYSEIRFTYSKLISRESEKFIYLFYKISKQYFVYYLANLNKEKQKIQDEEYSKLSEKQILIEILKKLDKVIK